MDASTFRQIFPEFADTSAYSDAQVNFYLTQGRLMLRSDRWGDLLDQGLQYFTAHQLVLARQRAKTALSGATPGETEGAVSSKSVDSVSVSFDTQSVVLNEGGHWNLTTYGVQFLQLARMVGAGPVQVNGAW